MLKKHITIHNEDIIKLIQESPNRESKLIESMLLKALRIEKENDLLKELNQSLKRENELLRMQLGQNVPVSMPVVQVTNETVVKGPEQEIKKEVVKEVKKPVVKKEIKEKVEVEVKPVIEDKPIEDNKNLLKELANAWDI